MTLPIQCRQWHNVANVTMSPMSQCRQCPNVTMSPMSQCHQCHNVANVTNVTMSRHMTLSTPLRDSSPIHDSLLLRNSCRYITLSLPETRIHPMKRKIQTLTLQTQQAAIPYIPLNPNCPPAPQFFNRFFLSGGFRSRQSRMNFRRS